MSLNRVGVWFLLVIIVAVSVATMIFSPVNGRNTITVEIANFEFKPSKVDIKPGDTIIFLNRDIVPHTATAEDGSWDTGNIAANESKSITVSEDMALGFYCFYHQAMKGQLIYSD